MRLLIIGERAEHRLLVRKHVEVEWPDACIVEHRLGEEAPLDPDYAAAGLDVVVVIGAPPSNRHTALAAQLLSRPEFAPLVCISLQEPPAAAPATKGIVRLYSRKIDRSALLLSLIEASRDGQQHRVKRRAQGEHAERYRFGAVMIRGHRCLRQLGSGGTCKVFLAESERNGALVVLKVFNQVADASESGSGFDRFLQEYQLVAALRHRHIVRIYDLGVADDHAYIAMEHFPLGDLRHRMQTPLRADVALHFLEQIASALDAIHSVGILHRDLKPANLMLRADGTLCLIDFGLAKSAAAESDLTGTREIFGTPYYMSPEQGHAEAVDVRSDLYSLGVIYYEMLTGTKPYTGATAMEVIYKHKKAEMPDLPVDVARYAPIVRRLLAKRPADRFQSASELLHAIATLRTPT
ncbi:MAG: serine/threonine protein kinase [Pseudomonadota bacterium]|nr:serine/threonine protein kinase [Pseudomonadota bacterium]